MAGQEDRGVQGTEGVHQAADPGGVHPGEGLVQQIELSAQGQGPDQGQAAAHSAGQGVGKAALLAGELGQGQPPGDLRPAGLGEHIHQVLLHRAPGEQAVLLKEKGSLTGRRGLDPAAPGALQSGQTAQQGGLAAAGGS